MASGRVPTIDPGSNSITTESPRAKLDPAAASTTGRMFFNLGKGLEDVSAQLEKAHTLAETTAAENHQSVELAKLELEREQDPDFSTEKQKKYFERIDQIKSAASEKISIPYARGQFDLESSKSADIAKIKFDGIARKRLVDNAKGNMEVYLHAQYKDFIGTDNKNLQEMAILRRDRKIDQMAEAGFISREDQAKFKTELPTKWHQGYAQHQAYSDPQKFLDNEATGYFKAVDPKTIESLRATAEKLVKLNRAEDMESLAIQQNQGEAAIASSIANGKYNESVLSDSGVDDKFKKLVMNSMTTKVDEHKPATETALIKKFMDINLGENASDPKKQINAMRDYRNEVFASRASLNDASWKKLLSWSDPQFVAVQREKAGFMKAAIEYFKTTGPLGISPVAGSAILISKFMDRATQQNITPEMIPALARTMAKEEAYKNNPDMTGLEEPTNYVYSGGNVSVAYPGESKKKSDASETEETVNVIRKSDGQTGSIPRKNFNAEKYKLA